MMNGIGKFTKLLFRQNAMKSIIWLVSLIGTTIAVAISYGEIYKTEADIYGLALTMNNPAMKAMVGAIYDFENYNLGAAFSTEMLLFSAIAVIIMNILFVSNSTRKDEEEGRLEMLRALPTGRSSYLLASNIMILILNLILTIVIGLSLWLIPHEVFTWEASFLYGAILGSTGLFFAGLTSFFAQLSDTSRGTSILSFSALIIFYIIRAIGDVSSEALSLLSPLGWTVRTEVFVENRWWPVLALTFGWVFLSTIALFLYSKRDIYSGLLPTRRGREHASRYLKSPIGLAFRIERGSLIAWTIGIFLMSLAFGAVLGDLEAYYADMELLQAFLPQGDGITMSQRFITLLFQIMSIFTAIPAVLTILKLVGNEKRGLMENFYSRAISRGKVMASYLTISIISTLIIQASIGVGLYLASFQVMDHGLEFWTTMTEVLAYLPAIWVIIGISLFLVGIWPKRTGLVWAYLSFAFIVLYLGNLLSFPDWVNNLSSFTHIPPISQGNTNWTALYGLSLLTLGLTFLGFWGYNKRDII